MRVKTSVINERLDKIVETLSAPGREGITLEQMGEMFNVKRSVCQTLRDEGLKRKLIYPKGYGPSTHPIKGGRGSVIYDLTSKRPAAEAVAEREPIDIFDLLIVQPMRSRNQGAKP